MTIDAFRLSPQQGRAWSGSCSEEGDPGSALGAWCYLDLLGPLDQGRLDDALGRVWAKHEILRSSFGLHAKSGGGAQFLHPTLVPELQSHDLRASADLDAALWVLERNVRPGWGDAETPPAPVLILARLEDERHRLLIALPAPAADRRGLENLVRELASAYDGSDASFEAEAMQYADVAEWQNELLEAEESRPGLAHWRSIDPGPGLGLEIPFQSPAENAYAPRFLRHTLDADLTRTLSETARNLGSTPANLLLTAWSTLLARLSRQADVLVGLGLPGRRYEELADSIGPLQRSVPLALRLENATTFRAALRATDEQAAEAERWLECFTLEGLQQAPARLPFAYEYHASSPTTAEAAGLRFELARADVRSERSLCRLVCVERGGALELTLDHDPTALSETTVRRLAGQLESLLRSALADPGRELGDLDALAAEERQALLIEFNDTRTDYDRERCAHHWIEEQAARTPDAVAVRFEDTELTYGDLERRANRLAHHLIERGVGPDVLVALCIERSVEMVVSIVGILKAGGAYVPVDPAYPKDRLAFLIEDTRAPVIVTQSRLSEEFAGTEATLVRVDDDAQAIAAQPDTPPATQVGPDNLVYVIYTSGSTGKPKGVVITHRKLVISNSARVTAFGHTPETFLLLSSFAFDSSVVGIFWTLCAGGTLLLIPEALQKDIGQIPKIIAAEKVSHLLTLPSFYQHLVEQASAEDLGGMRAAIVAGEACPLGMVEKHRKRLPEVGLFSEYGATETTVFSSVYDCLPQTLPIAPLGDPIDNAQMYVLDERMNPCPTGVPGEVHFGGEALAVGYWRRPELTAERFVPHPFEDQPFVTPAGEEAPRVYKSGDLARWLESGQMEFLGRLDNQVKIRGFRIELEEIEIALALHPAIKETAVLASTDLSAEKRLVAYLVPETPGASPSIAEMRDFLAETLPDYMVPGVFVSLPDFPRTPNGKVDRKALPEPGSERPELESEYQAAGSPAEVELTAIWCDVLGLANVGVNDNFFELGGDSILSIQIVSRAKQAGLKVTPRLVFENQTIASLAAVAEIDESVAGPGPQAEQGPVTGDVPLTPVQRWFCELDLPVPGHWNMSVLLRANRPLDEEHLARALVELQNHHDALRLRLTRDASSPAGWSQTIAPAVSGPGHELVSREDLSGLDDAAREAVIARHQATLDLEQGPLTRMVVLDRGEAGTELLWIIHHLAADGVAWRILMEDLETLLAAYERGERGELPSKTTSFQSWARGLEAHAATPELAGEAESWKAIAELRPTPLPVDHPGSGTGTEADARRVTVELDAETTRSLLSDVPRAYNTQIHEVLLTATVQAFAAWTGEPRVLVNLEGHGREDLLEGVDLSRTVGWFTTDAPVSLESIADPGQALRAIKEASRSTVERALRFGLLRHLVTDPAIRALMDRLPTPEIGFNYLGQFDSGPPAGGQAARLTFSPELAPAAHDPSGPRAFLVEVYGMVSGGTLTMHFEYSETRHERATIEALAQGFEEALGKLIAHCLSSDAGGFTESDFSEFDWSASDLESIAGAIADSQGTSNKAEESE